MGYLNTGFLFHACPGRSDPMGYSSNKVHLPLTDLRHC